MVRKGPENIQLQKLILELDQAASKNKAQIWRKAAFLLGKPTRQRIEANLHDVDCSTKEGDSVLVPGKLLSEGKISHKITIAAWKVSKQASEKLSKAGCKLVSINELLAKNPKGSKIIFIV